MQETRMVILTAEEVRQAVVRYVAQEMNVTVGSVRFECGTKTVDQMLDIWITALDRAVVQVTE